MFERKEPDAFDEGDTVKAILIEEFGEPDVLRCTGEAQMMHPAGYTGNARELSAWDASAKAC